MVFVDSLDSQDSIELTRPSLQILYEACTIDDGGWIKQLLYVMLKYIYEHLFIIIVIGVDIILDIYHFSGLHKKKLNIIGL